jgi:hypothetical protein
MTIVFPKGVRFEYVIAAALALGSCSGPALSDRQREEVTEISEDQADAVVSEKIGGLDDRLTAVEHRLNM